MANTRSTLVTVLFATWNKNIIVVENNHLKFWSRLVQGRLEDFGRHVLDAIGCGFGAGRVKGWDLGSANSAN